MDIFEKASGDFRAELSADLCRHNSVDKSAAVADWSDDMLLRRLDALAAAERMLLPEVLACVAEIERRRLHSESGFADLLAFCVERLKWSAGAAMQRIVAARAADLHPEIYAYLRDGSLNLSAVSRLASFLTRGGGGSLLLARAAGLKREALDRLLAELRQDQRRLLAESCRAESPRLLATELPLACAREETGRPSEATGSLAEPKTSAAAFVAAPIACERPVRLTFTASEELRRDLDRASFLTEGRLPSRRLEDLLAFLLSDFLSRRDPERRALAKEKPPRERPTRRIPRWVKDRVWRRDGGRCAYTATDGRRCAARKGLEYDHVTPWAKGGASDDPRNVRLLCRAHNRFLARRVFGDRVPSRRLS